MYVKSVSHRPGIRILRHVPSLSIAYVRLVGGYRCAFFVSSREVRGAGISATARHDTTDILEPCIIAACHASASQAIAVAVCACPRVAPLLLLTALAHDTHSQAAVRSTAQFLLAPCVALAPPVAAHAARTRPTGLRTGPQAGLGCGLAWPGYILDRILSSVWPSASTCRCQSFSNASPPRCYRLERIAELPRRLGTPDFGGECNID